MKKIHKYYFTLILLFSFFVHSNAQLILSENFETGSKPTGWSEEKVKGDPQDEIVNWQYYEGEPDGNPDSAAQGNYNALFKYESYNGETTKLITLPIDLEGKSKPELKFWHIQDIWTSGQDWWDRLKVYYKRGIDSSWVLLQEYLSAVETWTERTILLPDSSLSSTYYIAFEGITNYGHGVGIDSITIIETGIIPKYLSSDSYHSASTNFVATESSNNPILRMDFIIGGNTETAILDSITVKSLNSDDNDISSNGVKLYVTNDSVFSAEVQLGTGKDFTDEIAIFDNLGYDLPPGFTSVWVTYDIAPDPTHEKHDNLVDAQIEANSILINGDLYPSSDQSPTGNRTINELVFKDNFETDKGWILTGEFERDEPSGLGGSAGNSDPESAYSGSYVIGTDLTGLGANHGDYEPGLALREYKAISPVINCYYYKDVSLNFYRWLNTDLFDKSYIDISTDSINWTTLWFNASFITDDSWSLNTLNISNQSFRADSVFIRFSTGISNTTNNYSGWNIDDLFLTGDYIASDVGISEWLSPLSGCGHTSSDTVTVKVKNYGGKASNDTIPLSYSFDGGSTIIVDTLFGSIPVGEEITFTFTTKADLSMPEFFYNVSAATLLGEDEDNTNDILSTEVFVIPTYSPPYYEKFETNHAFWKAPGDTGSWEYGEPAGMVIDTAASGYYAWVTNLDGNYDNNDSSFVISPCFDFTRIENPIFELKLWGNTEEDVDGAALQYSIDNGETWQISDSSVNDFHWEWYSNDNISSLGTAGWDTSSTGWISIKHFLPSDIEDEPCVKFRMLFTSDGANINEGFAFDDVRIYDAPFDIGVSAINLSMNTCQFSKKQTVSVEITNFGIDSLNVGDTIITGIDTNGYISVIDTTLLTEVIPPGAAVDVTLSSTADLSLVGTFTIDAYTLIEEDPYYYDDVNNDSSQITVNATPNPVLDLGPDIYSVHPDTIILNAYAGESDYSYEWQDATTNTTFSVLSEGKYYVTVTNDLSSCFTIDSVKVTKLIVDNELTDLISPVSDCELGDTVHVRAQITNFGTDTIQVNDSIIFGYILDQGTPVVDTIEVEKIIYPDSSYVYMFPDPVDMNTITTYDYTVYSKIIDDSDENNDTATFEIEVYGYPTVDIGPDISVSALQYIFDAGAGFTTYLWNDSSSSQTYQADTSGWHWVSVTDVNGCPDADSAFLSLQIHDIGITSLIASDTSCGITDPFHVNVEITHFGTDTLEVGQSIVVLYELNSNPAIPDTFELDQILYPDDTFSYEFKDTEDLSIPGLYEFTIYSVLAGDMRTNNDTITDSVFIYDYPSVDLGNDAIIDTIEYLLDAGSGFVTYLWNDDAVTQTYLADGTGTYSVTVTDNNGCKNSDDINLTFVIKDLGISDLIAPVSDCELSNSELVKVQITNSGDVNLENQNIIIYYEVNDGPAKTDTTSVTLNTGISYTYTFEDSVDMTSSGSYEFVIYIYYDRDLNTDNDTMLFTVDVFGYPVIDFGDVNDTLGVSLPHTLDAGTGFTDYLWNDGAITQTYEVTVRGKYYVTVTDINGCQTIDSVVVEFPAGTDNILSHESGILIYPNPADNMLNVVCNKNNNEDIIIEIINIQNQIVFIEDIRHSSEWTRIIDISNWARGIYYIRIRTKDSVMVSKVIVI